MRFQRIERKIIQKCLAGRSQSFYDELLGVLLLEMGYGSSGSISDSGEINVLHYINKNRGEIFTDSKKNCGFIAFDIGANVGEYTKELINAFGKEIQVHAFEPSRQTFSVLKKNVGDLNNVTLINKGCSNTNCSMPLYTNTVTSKLASVYDRRLDHFSIKMSKNDNANFITVDSYCTDNNISHVDFMKIDVEGHEFKVLEGAKEMINSKAIDYIQFEFGGADIDSRIFFQDFWYMLSPLYRIYRIHPKGMHEIVNYSENLEIFKFSNFLAEKRQSN